MTDKPTPHTDDNTALFCYVPCEVLRKNKSSEKSPCPSQDSINDFDVYVAPATGPTGFVTMGFEKRFRSLVEDGGVTGEKWFVGSSTGALRWVALISDILERERHGPKRLDYTSGESPYSTRDRSDRLAEQYMDMTYQDGMTPDHLGVMMEKMYDIVLPNPDDIPHLLSHFQFHIAIMVVALHPRYINLPSILLKLAFMFHFLLYILYPPSLSLFIKRYCFYTGPAPPSKILTPFPNSPPITYEPLTKENIRSVLHATTGIPFIQPPCTYIPGLERGLYIDGGFTDLLLNFHPTSTTLLLSDHTTAARGNIKPSFFDIPLPWRKTPASALKMCGIVAPLRAFRMRLPEGRYPSVGDWFRREFKKDVGRRRRAWRACYEISCEAFPAVLSALVVGGGRKEEGDGTAVDGGLVDFKEE